MKAEINTDNFERFKGLYRNPMLGRERGTDVWTPLIDADYLELTSLADMTKEHAIMVAAIFLSQAKYMNELGSLLFRREKESPGFASFERILTGEGDDRLVVKLTFDGRTIEVVIYTDGGMFVYDERSEEYDDLGGTEYGWAYDKLREFGYLVPWNGLTCEEVIAAGWVKLKTVMT